MVLTLCLLLGTMSTLAFAADAKTDDIVILHTNDVHCGVTDGLGYAGVAAYKAEMEAAHNCVALAHLGMEGTTDYWTSEAVIENITGIDAMIDGHSHEAFTKTVANKSGKDVLLAQTGTKLANLGKLTIARDGTVTSELISSEDYTEKDAHITDYITKITDQFAADLSKVVATSEVDLIDYDENSVRLVRNTETNLCDLCADAFRVMMDADIGIMNGGGIRKPIKKGDVTLNTLMSVFPWGNLPCKVSVTGQTILDMLEMGAMKYPSERGGFLHVSGLKYSILPRVVSTIEKFVKVAGARRVCNVKVLNQKTGAYEAINVNKIYTLGGIDYTIRYCGDGFSMFDTAKVLNRGDANYTDAKMVTEYISTKLGGKIGSQYAEPQGRISVLNYQDVTADKWYANAIDYVTEQKLMNGYGEVFKPNQAVIRQELATILYKYAVLNGADPVTSYAVSYTDTISDWAMAGVAYCTATKLMTGVGSGRFGATSSATRAQGAQILMTIDKLEEAA